MACAGTLKRHREFDPLMLQGSPKRMCLMPPSTPTSIKPLNRGFRASPELMAPSFRRHTNHLSPLSSSASKLLGDSSRRSFMHSIIKNNPHSRLNLNDLLTSLTSNKKDSRSDGTASTNKDSDHKSGLNDSSKGVADQTEGPRSPEAIRNASRSNDVPTITMKMMDYIRGRVLQEFEEEVKEHFDRVLADKLTEQYESFLRFNHHQLTSKFHTSCASYVS